MVVSAQAQMASKNLDSSEKFFLGGAQGVRAYPANEAGGSIGQLFTLEWQKQAVVQEQPVTFATFYDAGHVVVNKFNEFATANPINDYSLSGVGFWAGTTMRNRWGGLSLRLTYSHRLGVNPGASSVTGLDQDGTLVINRLWFSLTQTF
jgi:hemolysin activation/secretion protein